MNAVYSLKSCLRDQVRALVAMLMAICAGCGSQSISDPVVLDTQIEEKWMDGRQMVDAIEFLKRGGQYENLGLLDESPVDQKHVLPLIERIYTEVSLKPVAILHTPERALAIVVPNPKLPDQRNRLRNLMQAADDEFPGLVVDNWGLKWVSIDFLDEREIGVLKSTGSLEPLQKELEFQRRQRD